MKDETRSIKLAALVEAKHNPRSSFGKDDLAELAASIKSAGVLSPLIVRSTGGDKYEIAAGHRRFRAAKIAGLTEVPCVVRHLNDDEFATILTLENLQRVDLTPLEECAAYTTLLERGGEYSIKSVAQRAGKSESYVARRLQLAKLIPAAQTLLREGKIELGHALLLCRIPEEAQKDIAVKNRAAWPLQLGDYKDAVADGSVQALQNYIDQRVTTQLKRAPWKLDDAALCPEVGACTKCPLRTGANTLLFDDLTEKDDRCLNPKCYQLKMAAHVAAVAVGLRAKHGEVVLLTSVYGEKKPEKGAPLPYNQAWEVKKGTKAALPALMVDGPSPGKVTWVTLTAPKSRDVLTPAHAPRADTMQEYNKRQREEQKKTQRERAIRIAQARAVVEAIPNAGPIHSKMLRAWCHSALREIHFDTTKAAAKLLGHNIKGNDDVNTLLRKEITAAKPGDLSRIMTALLVAHESLSGFYSTKERVLDDIAAVVKVDLAAERTKYIAAEKERTTRPAKKDGATKPAAKK